MSEPERFRDDIDKARDLQAEQPPARTGRGGSIPPVEHRFKPGQSGNPSGRRKNIFDKIIRDMLLADDQALAKKLARYTYSNACEGNRYAMQLIVEQLDGAPDTAD